MPEIEKKEPGTANVQQRERGDPRQHQQPVDKITDRPRGEAQDRPPASRDRSEDSPWMGGG